MPTNFNCIKVDRVVAGFCAKNSTGHTGYGNTAAEALGCLMLTAPDMFDITSIEYGDDFATRNYILERDLNKRIV